MDFSLCQNFSDVDPSPAEWNALLAQSITHVPFLRREYLHAWWETRGGGEWPKSGLVLVIAQQDGRLTGIAPLFSTQNRDGLPSLLLLGSIEISDYLDVIVRPTDLPSFLSGLLDFLVNSPGMPVWQVLDWYNIPETSPTLPVLEATVLERGWMFVHERTSHAPVISLPGDFEQYLLSIDKKQRHEIRRKMRRAFEMGNVNWYIVSNPSTLDTELNAFMALMADDPAKEKFLTEAMRHQMRLACRAAFENNWLQLAFLEINGEKVAGYLNFDYLGRIWVYNSGIDHRFMELSPGWVLLGQLLKWANENGRSEFDFMRGVEQYKYRFGAVDRFVVRARVTRS